MIGWHLPIHHRHIPHKVDGLPALFAASVTRRASMTLLGLFSPLYVLELSQREGFSLKASISIVLFYFFLIFLAKLVSIPPAENLGLRYGFRGTLLLSGIPFLFFIPILVWSNTTPWLIIPAALLWGIHNGFFWWGYHGFFVKAGNAISFGEEIGVATVFETIAMVITPFFGALLAEKFGFSVLFWLAGLFFLFSLALMVSASERRPKTDVRVSSIIKLLLRHKNATLSYLGNGVEAAAYLAVWPIFIFLTLGTALNVGGVVSASVIIAAAMTFLVGIWVDKRGEKEMISVGAPLLAFSWIMRMLGSTRPLFIASDSLWRFAEGMVSLPLNVITYKKALEGATDRAIMFRELAINLGPVIILPIFILMVLAGLNLAWTFVLAAVFSLLPLLAIREEN